MQGSAQEGGRLSFWQTRMRELGGPMGKRDWPVEARQIVQAARQAQEEGQRDADTECRLSGVPGMQVRSQVLPREDYEAGGADPLVPHLDSQNPAGHKGAIGGDGGQ